MSHAPTLLTIHLLGPPRIERNGQPVEVDTRKAIALLAYLALHPERLSRDQFAAFFWPEYDPERAYANLRRTLWALNKAIGDGWVLADNLSLHLQTQTGLWIDVLEFQQLLAQCRDHGHRSDEVCAACLEPLGRAVKLARGDFLEGFSLRDSTPFDDWLFFEAESLRKQFAATLEKLVQGHSRQQEDETAITYARRWLALDPLHEPAHRWLMQLYAWTGQPAAALRQYQECVRILKAELDAPPEAETTALYNRIRTKQIGLRAVKARSPQTTAVPALPTPPPVQKTLPAPTPVVAGELRMVTVLCAALAEPYTTKQPYPTGRAVQRVQQFLTLVATTLQRYDGYSERTLAEGVVALFGAQQLHEDDPERAVRAALDLQQAAQTQGLRVSAGLATGHLYLSRQDAQISAFGPVVNLALRLQAKADPGQILMSEVTYRQVRGIVVATPLPGESRGSTPTLPVYQIERLHPHPHKARGIAGLQAPLVGRAKELTALQEALTSLQQGEGQLVILIGEAGLGKSRLVSELRQGERQGDKELDSSLSPPHLVTLSPCLWLEGRCLEMSLSASYWPFLDILRAYLGWQPEENEARRAGRIVAALDALTSSGALTAAQRDEMGPLLGNLLAVRFGNDWDERLKFAGPEQIRHQTLIALRDLLVAIAQQQPLVLVLEDLHWADSLSLDLITLLMETLAAQPLLLLCVYRPEPQHRCWQLPTLAAAKCPDHFTEVRLRELTTKQSQQLVETLLTIENLAPKVKTTILQKAQGNPLFVEEVLHSLIDAGIVYRQGEVWRAKDEIENVVVPETVQSVILSRVDRLGDPLKGLLQRAAVIGRVFGRRLLAQLAPAELDLDNALSTLTNHSLIYQERVVPEEEYSFKHVLVQEAVYQTLLTERREQFHRQVGEALEQLYADNLAERYEQLAYHYERSGAVEKAIEYLLKAGAKARRAYLNDEAIGYFQRALERLDGLAPEETDRAGEVGLSWRLDALKGLGRIYIQTGKIVEAETHLRQAITLGKQLGLSPHDLALLFHWLGEALFWQSRYTERIALAGEGLLLLGSDQQSVAAALMNSLAAWGYRFLGDSAKVREFMFRSAQFILSLPYTEELHIVYIYIMLTYSLVEADIETALEWAGFLRQRAEQHHDLSALASVYLHIAWSLWQSGDLHGAQSPAQQSIQLYTKIGDAVREAQGWIVLENIFCQLGDFARAEKFALFATQKAEMVRGSPFFYMHAYYCFGVIALCQRDWAKAEGIFQKCIQFAQQSKGKLDEILSTYYIGRFYLAQGKRLAALAQFEQMLALMSLSDVPGDFYTMTIVRLLSALEEVCDSSERFLAYCQRLRQIDLNRTKSDLIQWFLEPTESPLPGKYSLLLYETFGEPLSGEWVWCDFFGDCSFTINDNLEIAAANGRNLAHVNLGAPRLLRSLAGSFAIQTICQQVSEIQPMIGGILLWKDRKNYLCLEKGTLNRAEIVFRGCLDNKDVWIGRGRLPAARVFLRLERIGERVNALCSADGEQWFTVGHVDFPVADPVQVGMHAIGMIDRLIYPGAYPDGTAIRFESFTLYRA